MRAILIRDGKGPRQNLYIGEAPKPAPAAGYVLVKIKAFGLNRMDLIQRNGGYPAPPGSSDILGVEFAGTVEEVGPGVTTWAPGDEVYGLAGGGAYAEFIVCPVGNVMRKPAHLSWVQAASIPENWLTAFQAMVLIAECKPGDAVLVHAGASGVGVAAIQLARLYGATTVIATASSAEKLAWVQSIPRGATHGVNYKTHDFAAEAKTITQGRGVDVVIDFVGQGYWHQNLDALAQDGRMVILGLLSGLEVERMNMGPILFKRLHIHGSTLRSRSIEYQAALVSRFQKEVNGKITGAEGAGDVRTYIHQVYDWKDIQEAHATMEANQNSGKIICEVV